MKKLTELCGLEVLDRNGRSLGHVHELRCKPPPSRATHQRDPTVTELLCGAGGIRARFGVRPRKLTLIAWSDIVAIEGGRLRASIEKPAS